jgi:calcineurin-like phosphoesterase family protein
MDEVLDTSKLWFSSDWHYDHSRIIEYCKRPFANTQEMNEILIKNYNDLIPSDGIVYFLGDFCWPKNKVEELKSQLKGTKTFIRGNHDRGSLTHIKVLELKTPDGIFRLSHDPDRLQFKGDIKADLVGHVHEHWRYQKKSDLWNLVNVGVDVWDFRPVAYSQIISLLN